MRKKQSRIAKLIKVRQNSLNVEVGKLQRIQAKLVEVQQQLSESQSQYFATIDTLNDQRRHNGHNLRLLEDGVDFYKQRLQALILAQKDWQDEERSQMQAVLSARLAVQSLEKLAERYAVQWQTLLAEQEQAQLDEFSLTKATGADHDGY